jgi:hypothetical protein
MADLEALYKWFDENRNNIIQKHEAEYVLVRANSVLGYFPNEKLALEHAKKTGLVMGDFLLQECIPKDEECMYYHNEAVRFA